MWIEMIIGLAGVVGLGLWAAAAWPVVQGMWRPRCLKDVRCIESTAPGPLVSVIVPACNEGASIRACLESLLRQDYKPLEIIAVDDRSTDETGRIMDELASGDLRLKALHIRELPPGWLGKNQANGQGARQARGRWLLFTDGDVFFAPETIRLAVTHAESEGLDHLCLFPRLICDGYFEKAAVCFFGLAFAVALRLRQIRNPLVPEAFCGIGAFNLVRATAYQAFGTHERLRMDVADDVKLGKLLKRHGFVTDILMASPQLSVRWQNGFRGVISGLEKNGFAGSDYRLGQAVYRVIAVALLAVLPLMGVMLAPGWLRVLFGAWLATEIVPLAMAARQQRFSWTVGFAFPVAACGVAFAVGRSIVLALVRGGIRWRGTFYPLKELRAGVV